MGYLKVLSEIRNLRTQAKPRSNECDFDHGYILLSTVKHNFFFFFSLSPIANVIEVCTPQCVQAAALVRQLRVMWGAGVGVSLEVLVAPECQHGAALTTTLDTPIAPSQNLRLIEQWNFTIYDRRYEHHLPVDFSKFSILLSYTFL